MRTEIDVKTPAVGYECAYPDNYQGFEFIYLKFKDGKKLLIFENRLAIKGIWLNNFQVVRIVKSLEKITFKETGKDIFSECVEIVIESYKHRGIGIYDKNGMLIQTPDYSRAIQIIDNKKLSLLSKRSIANLITKIGTQENCKFFKYQEIKLNKTYNFEKDFGFDVLDFIELVIECEKKLDISLPDDKLNNVKTLNQFFKLIENEL